jgi:hypothetical protein
MSSGRPTFLERREAYAQRRGNFVNLLEENDDDDIPLRTPVASPVASFDASDVGTTEAEGCDQAPSLPEVGSDAAAPLQPRKLKALPGPKTYVNDAYIDLRLNMAAQIRRLNIHKITNVSNKKQAKVDFYQANVLSPDGYMHGLQPYTCDDPYKKFWALIIGGVKYDSQNFDAMQVSRLLPFLFSFGARNSTTERDTFWGDGHPWRIMPRGGGLCREGISTLVGRPNGGGDANDNNGGMESDGGGRGIVNYDVAG